MGKNISRMTELVEQLAEIEFYIQILLAKFGFKNFTELLAHEEDITPAHEWDLSGLVCEYDKLLKKISDQKVIEERKKGVVNIHMARVTREVNIQ